METYKSYPTFLWIMLLLQACGHDEGSSHNRSETLEQTEKQGPVIRITDENVEAIDPYLLQDHQGNPVLCWSEKVSDQEGYLLKYAVFDSLKNKFTQPVTVQPSKGASSHAESMNKVGFKSDGTVVALFAKKHPTKENPFAGSILYTMSENQGKTWSRSAYLHSDTLPIYGRSFFDLATLPDGEVGAVWLDGRFGEADIGSALFFAKTEKGKGFAKDKQIGKSTCECCRTNILVDQKDRIHVAYRDITFSSAAIGQQIRDIAHIYSDDGGQTFSQPQRISPDNWTVEGCPHTGPSLTSNQNGLQVVWFTAGGQPGVYYAFSRDQGLSFDVRQMVNPNARHSQMLALSEDQTGIVWEEVMNQPEVHLVSNHAEEREHVEEKPNAQIILQVRGKNGIVENTIKLTDENYSVSHPVLTRIDKHYLMVAWVQEGNSHPGIFYKCVKWEH